MPSIDTTGTPKAPVDYSWLSHHLILLAITGSLVIGGVYGVESLVAKHDARNSAKWSSIYDTQTKILQQEQASHASDEQRWAAQNSALTAQMSRLAATAAQRNQHAQAQVIKDAALNTQNAAIRLTQQTHASPGEVVVQGDGLMLDLPVTRGIISSLDLLPVAQANLADAQKQLADETAVATNARADAAAEAKISTGFQEALKDANNSCKAQISVVKARARKSELKAFVGGVGLTLVAILGHML